MKKMATPFYLTIFKLIFPLNTSPEIVIKNADGVIK